MAAKKSTPRPDKPDNPNAFKHLISVGTAERLAREVRSAYPSFDVKGFLREAHQELPALELKPRVRLLSDLLAKRLPQSYPEALEIVLATLGPELRDGEPVGTHFFYYWVHASFVEHYGLAHEAQSLAALREITKRSTSEYAVRPYLAQNPERVLAYLKKCARDPNHHVRRWASEGSRPYLPWGTRAAGLLAPDLPTVPLLELLRADESEYVRTSVANHLNDLSKLQPDKVVEIILSWRAAKVAHVEWIAKRALRGLVKSGHAGALGVFGAQTNTRAKLKKLALAKKRIAVGDELRFELEIESAADEHLVIDYALLFPAAKGTSRKVFKLAARDVTKGETLALSKRHSFRPITTRVYRAGTHTLELLVNGKVLGTAPFLLTL